MKSPIEASLMDPLIILSILSGTENNELKRREAIFKQFGAHSGTVTASINS